jgi:CRISPR-associated exonuclease Cas4
MIPLSALNHFLYCPRRCGLIHVEGLFIENASTVEGQLRHETADTPGYESQPGVRVLRALPLFAHRLGLIGKADIVEFHGSRPFPVEYKRGKRKQWDNDDVQLCAQAFCLEEMFQVEVPKGAVFHASSRRRRDVIFAPPLRKQTEIAILAVRQLISSSAVPLPYLKPQCEGCSLHGACLPELQSAPVHRATQQLFSIEEPE